MPDSRLEQAELDRLYLGDRDLLRVTIDVARSEGRLAFSSARLTPVGGGGVEEIHKPELVLVGMRGFETTPETARPESIVLRWEFSTTTDGAIVRMMVIGDPEPVTLTFRCATCHLEYA